MNNKTKNLIEITEFEKHLRHLVKASSIDCRKDSDNVLSKAPKLALWNVEGSPKKHGRRK